jgi:cytochrome c biogenesis protein CcmG/thiol:disulfide interchange protein DsbE
MAASDELLLNEPDESFPNRGLTPGSIVLLIGILAVVIVVGIALTRQNQTQPTSGAAPDFSLTTLDGQEIRLSALRGKVVVINFWASWCVPCRDEAPALQAVWERYQDRGVVLLGVAWTDTERGARAFMAEFGQNYPNGLDLGTKIAEKYNITGVPETFIVDQEGHVAEFIISTITEDRLAASLDRLLAAG